jgi:hypothetical protein
MGATENKNRIRRLNQAITVVTYPVSFVTEGIRPSFVAS